jgi:anthranilate phosphoribosyltransferase
LKGKESYAVSGIVAANAGALYYLKNKEKLNISLRESVIKALNVIDSGEGFIKLKKLLHESKSDLNILSKYL